MIPVVLGVTAWIAKGVALTALPRLLKAVTAYCSPTPKTCLIPSPPLNQAVLQTPDRVIVFSYDNLSQLIGVNINNTPAASFSFDGAGNLLSLTAGNTTTAFTANNLNQRTTPGVNVYDAKGQTTDKDGRTFEWDDDGRMTAIVDGTHRSEFGFDGYGRRIKIAEFDNGVITSKKLYWWLGGEIVTEREGLTAGFPIAKQFFSQGVIANGIKLFYTWDQLGSVRELIDSTGVVRADYRYSTYGERTKESGDLDSDFGYAGLFHHGPSGLDLATYRTYDSAQGRWISRDPLGEGVDYNLYRYCGNSPIGRMDPGGLQPGSGGTWGENSILRTHGAPERASAGDVLSGAENEASFWGQIILYLLSDGQSGNTGKAYGAYREAQALRKAAGGWRALEGLGAEANLARHIEKHAAGMGLNPVAYAKAAEKYLERNWQCAYELRERPGTWVIVKEGKKMMYDIVDGVKYITTFSRQGH